MASDRLTDSLDRHWLAGAPLGRGTWGRSRLVRDAQGREAVLKEPLVEADFPSDAPIPDDLIAACRSAARQQADLLHEADRPCLARLDATIDLGGGRVGLLTPFYDTLERRLRVGIGLGEVLAVVHKAASVLGESGVVHGNLRPTNLLFDERGNLILADASTPAVAAHHARLAEQAYVAGWLPPEARRRPGGRTPVPGPLWDTWALCQLVHAAILFEGGSDDPLDQEPLPLQLAAGGLDKVALAALKDAAHARLAAESSNPRFRGRVTDRLGALLARGLSTEYEPSPPYRFATPRDLADRLYEILALLRPRVSEVGKILLPASAPDGVFTGRVGEPSSVSFTVTVGCTLGLSDPDDLVCGMQLVDLDSQGAGERRAIDDAEQTVQVHPSGRLRFQLKLPDVAPGRYRIRVAFAVKDSGDEPVVATGDFEVRPPPGYVPPRKDPAAPAALPFSSAGRDPVGRDPARAEPTRAPPPRTTPPGAERQGRTPARVERTTSGTERRPDLTRSGDTDRGSVVDLFPRPVAPPPDEGAGERASSAGADAETPPTVQRTRTPQAPDPEARPAANPPPPPVLKATPIPATLSATPDPARHVPPTLAVTPPPPPVALKPSPRPPEPRQSAGSHPADARQSSASNPGEPRTDTWLAGVPRTDNTQAGLDVLTPPTVRRTQTPPLPPRTDPTEPPSRADELPGTPTEDLVVRPLPVGDTGRGPLAGLIELVRRDPYVAVGTAVATSLVLVLVTTALLENC